MPKVLMKGNEAIAEAAIRAGCLNYFAYPITPQSEVAEYLAWRMPEVGGVFLQGESEVAVSYMIHGAASAGARAFTTSSSPGISLMSEGISLWWVPRYRPCLSTSCAAVPAWAVFYPPRPTMPRPPKVSAMVTAACS